MSGSPTPQGISALLRKAGFEKSKADVLDYLDRMLGVRAGETERAGAAA